jgi:hypothetical protein
MAFEYLTTIVARKMNVYGVKLSEKSFKNTQTQRSLASFSSNVTVYDIFFYLRSGWRTALIKNGSVWLHSLQYLKNNFSPRSLYDPKNVPYWFKFLSCLRFSLVPPPRCVGSVQYFPSLPSFIIKKRRRRINFACLFIYFPFSLAFCLRSRRRRSVVVMTDTERASFFNFPSANKSRLIFFCVWTKEIWII